jgi:Family of unknown function (DUF5302)
MTKSAKQDGKEGPAETAETESAATTDADAAEAADATPDAAAGPAAGDTTEDVGQPDIDDVKAKFREALDRKRQVHAEGQGKGAHEAGKVSGAHGPAASRRNFRRKSG